MSNKSAACKFIEAKTMVIPKPGKFPDVENKPIKSDSSGTDSIEDQKYQKDADLSAWSFDEHGHPADEYAGLTEAEIDQKGEKRDK